MSRPGARGAGRALAIIGSLLLTFAVVVPATAQDEKPLIGFSNILQTGCAFCTDVEESIKREAEARGWELFIVDNNVDANQILANADAMVTRGVDVYLDFDGGITDYSATYEKMQAAGIPVVFIDGPYPDAEQPDTYWLGANSAEAGRLLGQYAVDYAAENWDGQIDAIFATFQTTWPPETQERLIQAMKVISEAHPEFVFNSMDDFSNITINDVVLDPESTLRDASAFINAHPDTDKLLFIATTNDVHGLAEESALDSLGRAGDGVVLSMGADSSAQEAIRAGGDFKMSVAFGPERYGEKLGPIVEQILAGETPEFSTPADAFVVDASNIDEVYPQ